MVTHDRQLQIVDSINTTNVTFYGLSTDAKPTEGVGNGSCFIEMDTGKGYFFDVENNEWHEQSGGSGGGGSSVTPVFFTMVDETTDKTAGELYEAFTSGVPVYFQVNDQNYSDTQLVISFTLNTEFGTDYVLYTSQTQLIGSSPNSGLVYNY